MKRLNGTIFLFCALALVSCSRAQDNPVSVSIRAFVVSEDGTLVEATQAKGGDLVEYQVQATNTDETTLPSDSVTVVGPVPDISSYVSGSATSGTDARVEYSQDGSNFASLETSDIRAVRWTLLKPLEPSQIVNFSYRVKINGAPSASSSGDAASFTQSMFGHLGIVEIDCPESISQSAQSGEKAICGISTDSFDLFKQKWDLYADYESEVPVVPDPVSAWRSKGEMFTRSYSLNGKAYIITYFDTNENTSRLVLALY